MTVLLHISDPHFGTEQPTVVDALVRLARELAPEVVVLSGDVTQRARPSQFEAARAFVDRLGVARTLVVPGNHDIPLFHVLARVFTPHAAFERAFGRDLEPVLDTQHLLVVALNTTRRWRHIHGEVSRRQVERVAQRLRDATVDQLRIVVVHQPIEVGRVDDEHDRLRGHALAIDQWSRAGADLVLGGHIHLPYVLPLHERRPGLARRMWAIQAGTCVSSRVREGIPNSVNVIRAWDPPSPRGCSIERWDYDAAASAFARVATTALDVESSPTLPRV